VAEGTSAAAVRAFLIADVRGYTRFTHEHGDEAAARVAAAFAELARRVVESFEGDVIELRGDEALCVFNSARRALRAAVELQAAVSRSGGGEEAFPLPIGIGVDAGEAVPVEGGYRGGALNTAARLCGMAGPGQILATETAASLARRVEGIRFAGRRAVRLKGFQTPVRIVEVVTVEERADGEAARARRPAAVAGVAVAGVVLLAGAAALVLGRSSGPELLGRLDANAVGVIDAEAAGIVGQLTVGARPGAVASGGDYVWVASESDGRLSRIEPRTREVRSARVGAKAAGVAYGNGSVWVADAGRAVVLRVDPETLRVLDTIDVGAGPGPLAHGEGAVWVAHTGEGTVSQIRREGISFSSTSIDVGPSPSALAVGEGAVWVSSERRGLVLRVDPESAVATEAVKVGNQPAGIAVGEGSVWVANRGDGTVSRVDPAANAVSATIPVGSRPTSVAVGPGAVWVANSGDRTIARIDPDALRVVETVNVDSIPNALAVSGGSLWATTLPPFSFDAAIRGAWKRSTFRGSLDVTGAAEEPSRLTARLTSPSSYAQTFRFSVPAGAFDRSFPLPPSGVQPGRYLVVVSGVAGGRALRPRRTTVELERPAEGIVTEAWITAGRGGPVARLPFGTSRLVAHFIYTTKPAPGSKVTAAWFLGERSLGAVQKVSWRPLVQTTIAHGTALPPGRYRCVLTARGLEVAEAAVRVAG
jgi:YVTN family beta-propeller protein